MSFQEGERRPARARGSQAGFDQQTILVRRLIAAGAALVILILLFLGLRACMNSRKDSAFRDYQSNVKTVLDASNAESKALFQALSQPPKGASGQSSDALDVQSQVNTQRQDAEQQVSRAKQLDHPGELDAANNWIVQTLEFRANALAKIADAVPTALGDRQRKPAIDKIAGQMQALLASDVVYLQRAIPDLNSAYEKRGISADFPQTRFLPNNQILTWLDPNGVQQELDKVKGGSSDQAATSGLHGTGLGSVTVNGTELSDGDVNRVKISGPVTFEIQVENQGESEETDLEVSVTVSDGKDISVQQTIPRIAAGETSTVSVPLGEDPPKDGVSTVEIAVAPVPGEGTRDNNTAQYQVAFTS